jgi:hypothetical protein
VEARGIPRGGARFRPWWVQLDVGLVHGGSLAVSGPLSPVAVGSSLLAFLDTPDLARKTVRALLPVLRGTAWREVVKQQILVIEKNQSSWPSEPGIEKGNSRYLSPRRPRSPCPNPTLLASHR